MPKWEVIMNGCNNCCDLCGKRKCPCEKYSKEVISCKKCDEYGTCDKCCKCDQIYTEICNVKQQIMNENQEIEKIKEIVLDIQSKATDTQTKTTDIQSKVTDIQEVLGVIEEWLQGV